MNYVIGSIKHCERDRIDIWVKSALKYCSAQIILLVLDDKIPQSILELESNGVKIIHSPTGNEKEIDMCKWERHFTVREYIKTLNNTDVVLLTDTLDVVFQKDPFEWYKNNASSELVLTSEGIFYVDEHWNMRTILKNHEEFAEEIKYNEVINSGIIMGKATVVSDILLHIYVTTKGLPPDEGPDQPALNVVLMSSLIKNQTQIVTSDDGLVVHCAVAGPTEQFIPWGFDKTYKYAIPKLKDGQIIDENNRPFYMVHQYNRIHEWNDYFREKYKNVILPRKTADNKTATVICARSTSNYFKDWKTNLKFTQDDYVMCDAGGNISPPLDTVLDFVQDNFIMYSEDNLRKTFKFAINPSDKHRWNNGGGRNINWFYPHFRMMYFYKLHPEYDYYWFFDDDVTFPNNQLYDFIDSHKLLPHDAMFTYVFGNLNQENQIDSLKMDEQMGSYHSTDFTWLSHYPGPGDIHPETLTNTYGSYFPLVRLSNKALGVLVEEHENGCYGYSEGYVPTTLNHRGLSLYSIYDVNSIIKVDANLIAHHRRYHEMKWENV